MASSLFGTTGTTTVGTNNQEPNNLKSMLQQSSNPYATVQMLAQQGNQSAQGALSYLKPGMTARQAVFNELQRRGIPVQQFLQNPLFQ